MFDRFNKWYDSLPPNPRLASFLVAFVVAVFLYRIGSLGQVASLLLISAAIAIVLVFAMAARYNAYLRRKK